jgi:hypothetical protein
VVILFYFIFFPEDTPDDLAVLCGQGQQGWLLSSHIMWILDRVNMVSQTTIALCLNSATVNDLKGLQRRRQLDSIKKITFVVNLGVGQAGPFVSSFGKQSGGHWSLELEFHNKEHPSLLFCDTLGWDYPSDLINRVTPFLSLFGCAPVQDVLSIAHIPTPGPKHICSPLCLHYPIQTCSVCVGGHFSYLCCHLCIQ